MSLKRQQPQHSQRKHQEFQHPEPQHQAPRLWQIALSLVGLAGLVLALAFLLGHTLGFQPGSAALRLVRKEAALEELASEARGAGSKMLADTRSTFSEFSDSLALSELPEFPDLPALSDLPELPALPVLPTLDDFRGLRGPRDLRASRAHRGARCSLREAELEVGGDQSRGKSAETVQAHAVDLPQGAKDLHPSHPAIRNFEDALALGDYREALNCALLSLKLAPTSIRALEAHALALDGLGKWDEALQAYARLIAADDEDPESIRALADFHLRRAESLVGEKESEDGEFSVPGRPQADLLTDSKTDLLADSKTVRKADLLTRSKTVPKADPQTAQKTAPETALKTDPKAVPENTPEIVQRIAQKGPRPGPKLSAHLQQALIQAKRGHQLLLKAGPNSLSRAQAALAAEFAGMEAKALNLSGRAQASLQRAKAALALDPNEPTALEERGIALLKLGRVDEAKNAIELAVSRAGASARLRKFARALKS